MIYSTISYGITAKDLRLNIFEIFFQEHFSSRAFQFVPFYYAEEYPKVFRQILIEINRDFIDQTKINFIFYHAALESNSKTWYELYI